MNRVDQKTEEQVEFNIALDTVSTLKIHKSTHLNEPKQLDIQHKTSYNKLLIYSSYVTLNQE